MDTNTLTWKLFELVSPVVAVGLIWLSVRVAQLASAKLRTEHVRRVMFLIDTVVFTAVREVHQILAGRLKAASPDGRLTADQASDARRTAIDSAKAQLGPVGIFDVTTTLGLDTHGLDRVLASRVEATVHRLKRVPPAHIRAGTAGDAVSFTG